MKKILSGLCAFLIIINLTVSPVFAAATRKNFKLKFTDCLFTDVPEGHYAKNDIQDSFFWGIIKGDNDYIFRPDDPATMLFVLQTAVRMWDIYMGGAGCLPIEYGYDMLYDTAENANLLKNVAGYDEFENLDTRYSTRKQMAQLFVNTMPDYEFNPINIIWYGPKDMTDDAVKKLYMAGVLLGDGESMNEDAVVTRAQVAVAANRIATWRIKKEVELNYDTCLSEFSTRYAQSNYGRSYNIALAASSFNDKIIYPGAKFSFNNTVGSRSASRGYMNASVLVNGKYEEGVGGGVCQVSSTLFNSALLANLKITERHAHSLATAYLPRGKDATVYYGELDFSFVNSLNFPIKIKSSAGNGVLTISIWGDSRDKPESLNVWVEQSGNKYILKRAVNGIVDYTTTSSYDD